MVSLPEKLHYNLVYTKSCLKFDVNSFSETELNHYKVGQTLQTPKKGNHTLQDIHVHSTLQLYFLCLENVNNFKVQC